MTPNALTLRLDDVRTSRRAIHGRYSIGDLWFSTTTWYDSVDFDRLETRYGAPAIRRIAFHAAAFEVNKLASLRPDAVDWGPFADLATPEFQTLWSTIYRNVWAQWRLENEDFDYLGPVLPPAAQQAQQPIAFEPPGDGPSVLAFCGGGKDSLLAMELLSAIGAPFDTLTYSASFYGRAQPQHDLVAGLAELGGAVNRRRQWVTDDFLDVPVSALRPDFKVRTVTAAETPSSIFAALPYALEHGYRYLCLAHERSADTPQAFFPSGEPVNHQWGKSYAAERLINDYIGDNLLEGFNYFSIIKPLYDLAIFGSLRNYQASIPKTHSCNIAKPWCMACPKCLYVWAGYAAFLDPEVVSRTFDGRDPLHDPANIPIFRQLTGLQDQLPFECIGEADETAIYLLMCKARGYQGPVLDACAEALSRLDPERVIDKHLQVGRDATNVPPSMEGRLMPLLERRAGETARFIKHVLALKS
jgi:hypothetical protein